MTETFTAAQVRDKANANRSDAEHGVEDWREIVAMLDAFATRLEQEEAGAFASILAPAYELGRAQGRLDALRAVTAHPGPVTYCPACKSFTGQHEPTCSWLRAKSITQSAAGQ